MESTGRVHQPSPICSGPCQGLSGFQNRQTVQALVRWAPRKGGSGRWMGVGIYPSSPGMTPILVRREPSGAVRASSFWRIGQ